MTEPDLKQIGSSDFIPEKYVRELSQSCVGGTELVRLRKKIQFLSDETSGNLKKNVYQNYMQFIDTAKEISHLESEMYQLSHLLSEQRLLLSGLSSLSSVGNEAVIKPDTTKTDVDEQEQIKKQKLATILEKVEGCSNLLDVATRTLSHEGDLLELDPVENTPLKRIHGYLFNDGLMLAIWNANRRGPMRYKFGAFYELGSLAVVNVRDMGSTKHVFKLLAFPDTIVFQCTSNSSKKEWLDKFDQAKKSRLTHDQIKRESMNERSPSRSASIETPYANPFDEPDDDSTIHPDWVLELSEELDVCVAQRHFEEALSLLKRAKEYITQFSPNQMDHVLVDMEQKIEQRQAALTEVLMNELKVNPDKSLQGGLRAARRAVKLLNQLGRCSQSCDLFLKLCSSMMRAQCKRVKREGSTNVYIRHLSTVVFTNMCHMTEEFLRAFPDSPSCTSSFVVWASSELNFFTNHFIKQVFVPQTTLSTLTDCVILVRDQCERLCNYGIDLCYQLDGALRTHLTKSLGDTRDKYTDAVKLRALEDKWIPMNLKSKSGLSRTMQEYSELGIALESHVTGDCWLQLTMNTLSFTKVFMGLLDNCLKLQTPELLYTVDEVLYEVFQAQLQYIDQMLRTEKQPEQRKFIIRNANFLLGPLLEVVQKKYSEVVKFECRTLVKLSKENSALLHGVTPTSRHKYSSNEYL